MVLQFKHSILFLSVIAIFSACTENKKVETSETPVVTEKVDCLYSFDASTTKVFWAAFKTEDKLKVVGQFKDLKTDRADQKFSSLEALVNGINFSINSASSASGDEIRDLSLKDYFFQLFTENFEINGSLTEMNEESITATINLFGTIKNIKLTYSADEEVLKMKGTLSLEEFGALKAYNSIHEKCFDLHKGKTWDDVDVIIEVPILKDCQ
jgi:hypothetical protein